MFFIERVLRREDESRVYGTVGGEEEEEDRMCESWREDKNAAFMEERSDRKSESGRM